MGLNSVKDIVTIIKAKHGWEEDELLKKESMRNLLYSFSQYANVFDYKDGVLFIEAPSSAALQELSMKKQEMAAMLREKLFRIKEIKFVMKGKRV
ncbi:MAG: DciA family protein [Elusimicrobiota bacterium]